MKIIGFFILWGSFIYGMSLIVKGLYGLLKKEKYFSGNEYLEKDQNSELNLRLSLTELQNVDVYRIIKAGYLPEMLSVEKDKFSLLKFPTKDDWMGEIDEWVEKTHSVVLIPYKDCSNTNEPNFLILSAGNSQFGIVHKTDTLSYKWFSLKEPCYMILPQKIPLT